MSASNQRSPTLPLPPGLRRFHSDRPTELPLLLYPGGVFRVSSAVSEGAHRVQGHAGRKGNIKKINTNLMPFELTSYSNPSRLDKTHLVCLQGKYQRIGFVFVHQFPKNRIHQKGNPLTLLQVKWILNATMRLRKGRKSDMKMWHFSGGWRSL